MGPARNGDDGLAADLIVLIVVGVVYRSDGEDERDTHGVIELKCKNKQSLYSRRVTT